MWRERIAEHLLASADLQRRAAEMAPESISQAATIIVDCYRAAGKVLICGNGGSAADAQHMAAEFLNRLNADFDRPGLPAIALTTDTSFLTSYANDFNFEGVFERQVLALSNPGDVLIGITTSGSSRNVLKAIAAAREKSVRTISLSGQGGAISDLVDCAVVVPSRDTQHVQECLLSIEHIICDVVERTLFGTEPG
ncbi:MAG TPA: SIS domain-containing protein [Pyrinomonadaceae bacterium]|nr:SIS domain-containing protein [Pyrinomonadaceae bacterium]